MPTRTTQWPLRIKLINYSVRVLIVSFKNLGPLYTEAPKLKHDLHQQLQMSRVTTDDATIFGCYYSDGYVDRVRLILSTDGVATIAKRLFIHYYNLKLL